MAEGFSRHLCGPTARFGFGARYRMLALALLSMGLLAIGSTIVFSPAPRLVWNVSPSMRTGLYRVDPGATIKFGDVIAARTPASVRQLAASRGYLPSNVPLVKRIAGMPGDRVCTRGPEILVSGRRVARRFSHDPLGRAMPLWSGCILLDDDAYFLLGDDPRSFDGRYFGPSERAEIIGKATLLWSR